MSLVRLARGVTSLVFDAVEAVVYLFDWSDPADKIWADACDRLVEKEAEEEVAEPGRGGGNDVSQGAEPSSGTLWEADSHGQAIAQAFTAINAAVSAGARNAPYTEVLPSSSADGLAHSPEPLAEDSPAGPEISGSQPRRAPTLTCDDFMDAARAAREKGDQIEHPNFASHWHELAERLEIAAISAAPKRVTVKK